MPKIVNIHAAKTHLSKLVEEVSRGEEVVIAKAGRPVAKLVRFQQTGAPRKPGSWKGKVRIAENFDELPPEIEAAFRGELD